MEYTTLGKSGISVSRVCLGTWQASGWSTSDDAKFITTVKSAVDAGINFIDTAELYGNGHSESLIGKALKGDRSEVVLATKFSHKNTAPAKLRRSLEDSLRRLGTDYIDLYQYHWPSPTTPLAETIEQMIQLKEEGKIRAIGVSNWMEPEWSELSDYKAIDSLQPCYSLLWRSIEKEVLPLCVKHSISVLPYSPLCQGILAGKFKNAESVPKDPRSHNVILKTERFKAVSKFLDLLSDIEKKTGKSMSQLALRWLLQRNGVTSLIVGASTPEQISHNCDIFSWELSAENFNLLDQASAPLSADLKPHDTLWNWHSRK